MTLLCGLGLHSPSGIPRWNDGYYFARCSRCGCDIVRTAYEKWHVPDGFRVVWSADPPVDRPDIKVVPTEAPSACDGAEPASVPAAVSAPEPAPLAQPLAPPARFDVAQGALTDRPAMVGPEPLRPPPRRGDTPPAERPDGPERAQGAAAPAQEGALPIEAVFAQLRSGEPEEPGDQAEMAEPVPTPPQDAAPADADAALDPRVGDEPPSASGGEVAEAAAPPAQESTEPTETQQAATEPAANERNANWDFMEDDPADELLIVRSSGAIVAPPSAAATPPPAVPPWPPIVDSAPEDDPEPRPRVNWLDYLAWGGAPAPLRIFLVAMVGAAIVTLLVILFNASPPAVAPAPEEQASNPLSAPAAAPAAAPATAPARARAARAAPAGSHYVAASLLSCRSAPSRQGRRVRTLTRGTDVEILAFYGEWASIGVEGRQCWTEARFLSDLPPA